MREAMKKGALVRLTQRGAAYVPLPVGSVGVVVGVDVKNSPPGPVLALVKFFVSPVDSWELFWQEAAPEADEIDLLNPQGE